MAEIIIINDGSTDHTNNICKIYAKQYSNVKVVNQQNAGVSSARNHGINIAHGNWITFCDCDDTVTPNWLKDFSLEKNQEYDLISTGLSCNNWLYQGRKNVFLSLNTYQGSEISKLVLELYQKNMLGFVWNKVFKKQIIQKHCLQFNTNIKYKEDLVFTLSYILYTNKILQLPTCNYNYIFSTSISKFGAQDSFFVNLKITHLLKRILIKEDFLVIEKELMHETATVIVDTYIDKSKTFSQHQKMWKELHSAFDGNKIITKRKLFNIAYCYHSFFITDLLLKILCYFKRK